MAHTHTPESTRSVHTSSRKCRRWCARVDGRRAKIHNIFSRSQQPFIVHSAAAAHRHLDMPIFCAGPKRSWRKITERKNIHTHRTRNITSHLRVATYAARTHIIPRMFERLAPGTGEGTTPGLACVQEDGELLGFFAEIATTSRSIAVNRSQRKRKRVGEPQSLHHCSVCEV